jgi:hypothetical protein
MFPVTEFVRHWQQTTDVGFLFSAIHTCEQLVLIGVGPRSDIIKAEKTEAMKLLALILRECARKENESVLISDAIPICIAMLSRRT